MIIYRFDYYLQFKNFDFCITYYYLMIRSLEHLESSSTRIAPHRLLCNKPMHATRRPHTIVVIRDGDILDLVGFK